MPPEGIERISSAPELPRDSPDSEALFEHALSDEVDVLRDNDGLLGSTMSEES